MCSSLSVMETKSPVLCNHTPVLVPLLGVCPQLLIILETLWSTLKTTGPEVLRSVQFRAEKDLTLLISDFTDLSDPHHPVECLLKTDFRTSDHVNPNPVGLSGPEVVLASAEASPVIRQCEEQSSAPFVS